MILRDAGWSLAALAQQANRCDRLAPTSWTMGQLRGKPSSRNLHARFRIRDIGQLTSVEATAIGWSRRGSHRLIASD